MTIEQMIRESKRTVDLLQKRIPPKTWAATIAQYRKAMEEGR